jgi:hypothetical protein
VEKVRGQRPEVGGRRSERKKGKSGGFIGFSELGAGCSKDGLGQDVPATVKMRARCPRTLFESRFISDLGLSTFGPSALHFQNFSVSAFRFYPMGWDKYWYRQKISEKIFQPLSIPHSRVPLNHKYGRVSRE